MYSRIGVIMSVIDVSNSVLGRMATAVAGRLLKRERIVIINAENAVISGRKEEIVKKYRKKLNLQLKGNPEKGPKYPRMPDGVVSRAVRGMLPYKRKRGKEAFKNLRVYIGVPKGIDTSKVEKIPAAENKLTGDFISVDDLCKAL